MKPRKVPERIKKLIDEIESIESKRAVMWRELYEWLESKDIDCGADQIATLQDGTGAQVLIKWLEEGHSSDYD